MALYTQQGREYAAQLRSDIHEARRATTYALPRERSILEKDIAAMIGTLAKMHQIAIENAREVGR